jgi:hypothetical protein
MTTETEQLVVSLEARIRDFERNFERANATATKNWQAIESNSARASKRLQADMAGASAGVTAAFERIGSGITRGLALAGIGVGVGELATQIRGVVADAAHLVDIAETIGVSTKALQELRYAGGQAGVDVGDLDDALAKFSKQIGDASRGSGDLYKILQANGIAIRDQTGNIRPLIDLFRDYADLVSRASSAQEKNTLVTIAFGKSADDLGRMFDGGAAGIDAATDAADRLGLVINDGRLQNIAKIDDEWDAFATTLSTKVKSAILGFIDDLDTVIDQMNKIEDQSDRNVRESLAAVYAKRDEAKTQIDRINSEIADAPSEMAKQMARDALPDAEAQLEKLTQQALHLRDILDSRQGWPGEGGSKPATPPPPPKPPAILPPTGGGSGGGTGGDDDRQKKIAAVITALRFEGDQLGRTAQQQELYNRLKQAGVDLDSKEGQAIAALVEKNEAAADALAKLKQAQEQFNERGQYLGESVASALDAVIVQGESAGDVVANLAKQLASAALQASLLGTGPLAGLFGSGTANPTTGTGGGILGALGSFLFGGFRAGGGDVEPGKVYAVGEKRPELFVPGTAGTILPSLPRASVGTPSASSGKSTTTNNVEISMPITVNGSAGTPAQNADLADKIQRTMEPALKGYVLNVLRDQMRPNGLLRR